MENKKLKHIVQDKIKEVEHKIIPGVSWDKQKSWDKIREILASKNKQLLLWYFATAASISVLMATSMDTTIPYLQKLINDQPSAEIINPLEDEATMNAKIKDRVKFDTERLDFKKLDNADKTYSKSCLKSRIRSVEVEEIPDQSYNKHLPDRAFKSIMIAPQLNANVSSSVSPSISVDFRHYFSKTDYKVSYISLGASTNFIFQNGAEGQSNEIYPATFINAKYGQTRIQTNKAREWEIGAGYLLNPNQVIYKDTTVRFHYLRTISGKLKAGPEVIFTNNMTKLYPGFTLAFG